MLGAFEDYVKRQQQKHDKFDSSDLDQRFIAAYNDGQRIRVKFPWGEVKTGRVGVTTGWKPVFLLIRNRNQICSSDLLRNDVIFTSEKCTRGGL